MDDAAIANEIQILRARLAALEQGGNQAPVATLDTLGGRQREWSHEDFTKSIIPPPSPTVRLHTLIGADGLPKDEREFRRVLEAIALCHGISAPTVDVPRTWIALMRDTYAARRGGSSWTDALRAAGLELQLNEADLTSHYQAIKAEMGDLYDRIPAMVKWIERYTGAYTHRDLILKLRQLLM